MTIYTSSRVAPYVYQCTNRITGEFYIGYRCANNKPSHIDFPLYKTSSKEVKPVFDQFDWSIIAEFFDKDSAYDFEQKLIDENWGNPLLLNRTCYYGKKRLKPRQWSEEKRRLVSIQRKGFNKGRVVSNEVRERISNTMSGKVKPPRTKEHSEAIRISKVGILLGETEKYKGVYELTLTTSEKIIINDLLLYCKANGLCIRGMRKAVIHNSPIRSGLAKGCSIKKL